MSIQNKIALGTVQFGLDYGISNESGKVPTSEVKKILNLAHLNHIKFLDTAWAYGESEKVLGQNKLDQFKIITKFPELKGRNVSSYLEDSLSRLNLKNVYGYIAHAENEFLGENANKLYDQLQELKEAKKVKKIGVSAYSPEVLLNITEKFDIDLVQIPLSIFDQSFLQSGALKELKSKNIEIHTRSAFLQGLVFVSPHSVDPYFKEVMTQIDNFHKYLKSNSLKAYELCLSFLNQVKEVDQVVLGVSALSELSELLSFKKHECNLNDFTDFDFKKDDYSKPHMWKLMA